MQRKTPSIILFIICTLSALSSQSQITRGAVGDELYLSTDWYIDNNGKTHYAIYHSVDNGETIELKYENFETPPEDEMKIGRVLGDADTGVIYNYGNNELWVSFDFGVTWEYQQDSYGYAKYYAGEDSGKIFRGDTVFSVSTDFGSSFEVLPVDVICPFTEIGFAEAEFYGIYGVDGSYYHFVHTIDYGQSCTEIPVDSSVAFWAPGGNYPKISRGTQSGEIYLLSWQYNSSYKVFLSSDTGYTWTEQFASDYINLYFWRIHFTAGREPGSFYVMRSRVSDSGDHIFLYIDYSSDYGQTFTTWFHDLDSLYTSVNSLKKHEIKLSTYPNPFRNTINIEFETKKQGRVWVYVTNIQGKLVKEINNSQLPMGKYYFNWDGTDANNNKMPNGSYLIRMVSGKYQITKSVQLIY